MTDNTDSKPTAAGKSSFDLIDIDVFYRELDLKNGWTAGATPAHPVVT